MEDLIGEYFNDSLSEKDLCQICSSHTSIKKCICGNYYCENCIKSKKNEYCVKNCYTFQNGENTISQIYNISKMPLPKNFNAQLYFSNVDWIRSGITLDSNIVNDTLDSNCPPYNIFYILENLQEFYIGNKSSWLTYFNKKKLLLSGDFLNIQLKNGELRYFLNGEDLGKGYTIGNKLLKDNDIYLLVHRRNNKSKCEIVYIYDLTDESNVSDESHSYENKYSYSEGSQEDNQPYEYEGFYV